MADEDFAKAVAKGARLLNLTRDISQGSSAASILQSPFTKYTDLTKHGYIEIKPEPVAIEPLSKCLQAFGVDEKLRSEGGMNVQMFHAHSQKDTVGDTEKTVSHAHFSQTVNRKEGVLIAVSNLKAYPAPVKKTPQLKYWSDVAYLQLLGPSATFPTPSTTLNLKYIIRHGVANSITQSMVGHILDIHDVGKPVWPGIELSMDTDEGKAILSTPNGWGVAYLLAQHKAQLGLKTVDKVTIFYTYELSSISKLPSLVFWLRDLEEASEEEG
ncbi:hypothetical protein P171DRAFT_518017 [Karstenula rhodostoma CBS 690.94]|uniref:Uncharacterized protein n=1 Tax=Karstenula rhodostoma CBS 690.94 TaxID=1392251 RepID=A0A9P4PSF2_9PLEO|nr:hypothetical protein P171DRAFT_518017 [Karstenula rhodostoma CBS 690.94]